MGSGGGWGAKGGFFHTFDWKSSHCVSTEVHKRPQFTCQADTVTDSSSTPSVALLVHPSGTAHSTVDCHEFQGHRNDASGNRPGYLWLFHWCVWILQESAGQANNGQLDY